MGHHTSLLFGPQKSRRRYWIFGADATRWAKNSDEVLVQTIPTLVTFVSIPLAQTAVSSPDNLKRNSTFTARWRSSVKLLTIAPRSKPIKTALASYRSEEHTSELQS